MKARKLFAAAGVVLLLIIGAFVLDSTVYGDSNAEDVFECVGENEPSSGFVDDSQGGCPISIESYNEYRELVAQTTPAQLVGRILVVVFLLLLVAGTILGIVNIMRSRRRGPGEGDEAHA